jgi:mono/diheme cytochrome c family protein
VAVGGSSLVHRRSSIVVLFFVLAFLGISSAQTIDPIDGAKLYAARCANCHGKSGRGDGEVAGFLNPRPRDFTSGRYKFRSTETGSLPTDDDLARSISEGLHSTSMPAWKPFLQPRELDAVVSHIKSLSPRFASEQPQQITLGLELPSTPENSNAGRAVYDTLKCAACHGTDGRGTGAIAQALRDDWGRPTRATDLTEPWTFRGGDSVRDIFLRFRTGMNGTPMPSFLGAATEPELWQLAIYVKSIGRKPLWNMNAPEVVAFYKDQQQRASADLVKHGEYIASVVGCAFCHTPNRADNTMIEELKYAGGQRFRVEPFGDFVSYNLTSDKETGLGNWTDDEIKTFVTKGIRRDGSRMLPYPMPWPNYAHMTPGDLNAVIAFLRSLPPVSNRIPAPRQPNIVSFLAGKFRMLILKEDPPMYIYPGNAGSGASR